MPELSTGRRDLAASNRGAADASGAQATVVEEPAWSGALQAALELHERANEADGPESGALAVQAHEAAVRVFEAAAAVLPNDSRDLLVCRELVLRTLMDRPTYHPADALQQAEALLSLTSSLTPPDSLHASALMHLATLNLNSGSPMEAASLSTNAVGVLEQLNLRSEHENALLAACHSIAGVAYQSLGSIALEQSQPNRADVEFSAAERHLLASLKPVAKTSLYNLTAVLVADMLVAMQKFEFVESILQPLATAPTEVAPKPPILAKRQEILGKMHLTLADLYDNDPELQGVHNQRAERHFSGALQLLETAADGDVPAEEMLACRDLLGTAYARIGEFDLAVEQFSTIVAVDQSSDLGFAARRTLGQMHLEFAQELQAYIEAVDEHRNLTGSFDAFPAPEGIYADKIDSIVEGIDFDDDNVNRYKLYIEEEEEKDIVYQPQTELTTQINQYKQWASEILSCVVKDLQRIYGNEDRRLVEPLLELAAANDALYGPSELGDDLRTRAHGIEALHQGGEAL